MKKRLAFLLIVTALWAVMVFLVKRTGGKPEVPPSPVPPGCTFIPGPYDSITPTEPENPDGP